MTNLRHTLRFLATHRSFTAAAVFTLAIGLGANTALFGLINVALRPLDMPHAEQLVSIAAETRGDDSGGFQYTFSLEALYDLQRRATTLSHVFGVMPRVGGLSSDGKAAQFFFAARQRQLLPGARHRSASRGAVHADVGIARGCGAGSHLLAEALRRRSGGHRPARCASTAGRRSSPAWCPRASAGRFSPSSSTATCRSRTWESSIRMSSGGSITTGRPCRSRSSDDCSAGRRHRGRGRERSMRSSRAWRASTRTPTVAGRARVVPEPWPGRCRSRPSPEAIPVVRCARARARRAGAADRLPERRESAAGARDRSPARARRAVGARRERGAADLADGARRPGHRRPWRRCRCADRPSGDAGRARTPRSRRRPAVRDPCRLRPAGVPLLAARDDGRPESRSASGRPGGRRAPTRGRRCTTAAGRSPMAATVSACASALVVGQIAGSLALLTVAALFAQTLAAAKNIDLGFDADHLVTVRLDARQVGLTTNARSAFFDELLHRVRSWGDVAVGADSPSTSPMSYLAGGGTFFIEGQPRRPARSRRRPSSTQVGHDYFETMQIPIVRGRAFTRDDENERTTPRAAWPSSTRRWRSATGRDRIRSASDSACTDRTEPAARSRRRRPQREVRAGVRGDTTRSSICRSSGR